MSLRFESRLIGGTFCIVDHALDTTTPCKSAQHAWEQAELRNAVLSDRDPRPYTRLTQPQDDRTAHMTGPTWTSEMLVHMARDYDKDRASDGYSRYGSYVGGHETSFTDVWNDRGPLEAHTFTALAWRIAADGYIMSPGLVWRRDDIQAVAVEAGGNDQLTVTITLAVTHDMLRKRPPFAWQDWDQYSMGGDYRQHSVPEPRPGGAPIVTLSAQIAHAGPWATITPQHTTGRALVDECLQSVELTAKQINHTMGPLVRQLLEGSR